MQVFEVGTATMMAAKGAVYPVYQLMADARRAVRSQGLPRRRSTATTPTTDGKLLSMPFNSSTPVIYCNKELFEKAGLDPNMPPKTWPELGETAKKLPSPRAPNAGSRPQWQTWTMIENFGAWHNLPYRHQGQRLRRHRHRARNSTTRRTSSHIQMLADWQKDKTFVYGGREGKSTALFTAGECAHPHRLVGARPRPSTRRSAPTSSASP